nr:immunoglobulin heavy chain junction region [Mus musculus]
CVRAGGDCW